MQTSFPKNANGRRLTSNSDSNI